MRTSLLLTFSRRAAVEMDLSDEAHARMDRRGPFLTGDEPRPLFAFPGLWRRWRGPLKKGGPAVDLDVYAFMTTLPNALVATVNHERMPVLR